MIIFLRAEVDFELSFVLLDCACANEMGLIPFIFTIPGKAITRNNIGILMRDGRQLNFNFTR